MGKCREGGLIKRVGDTSSLRSVLHKHSSSHRKGWTSARAHPMPTLPQNYKARQGSTDAANDRQSVNLFGGN